MKFLLKEYKIGIGADNKMLVPILKYLVII